MNDEQVSRDDMLAADWTDRRRAGGAGRDGTVIQVSEVVGVRRLVDMNNEAQVVES